jgi:hypothetical protein
MPRSVWEVFLSDHPLLTIPATKHWPIVHRYARVLQSLIRGHILLNIHANFCVVHTHLSICLFLSTLSSRRCHGSTGERPALRFVNILLYVFKHLLVISFTFCNSTIPSKLVALSDGNRGVSFLSFIISFKKRCTKLLNKVHTFA